MGAAPNRSRQHYQLVGAWARFVYMFCGAVVVVLGVAMVLAPVSNNAVVAHAVGFAMAIFAGWFLLRLFRWATIDLYEDSVVIRGIFRTARMAVADIDRFVMVQGVNDVDEPASALAVRARNGTTTIFPDFSSSDEETAPITQLVDQLNHWIAA
jgi:hypothetical protein